MDYFMKLLYKTIRLFPLFIFLISISGIINLGLSQEQKWIRVGDLQCYFYDYGAELESDVNFLIWPALYGNNQTTCRGKGMWLGAQNFTDPLAGNIVRGVKVIGIGPRSSVHQYNMFIPQSIKLVGKFEHPDVIVNDKEGSSNPAYDMLDDFDESLPCDRMVVIKFNTSMGVSVTKKVLAFTQQDHDDYFIYDYVFKNTGIYNKDGDVFEQTLTDFWIYFTYRYAFAGVTSSGWGSTWGAFSSLWGGSTMQHNFDINDPEGMRGYYCWYGPTSADSHPLTAAEDWGCPDHEETGVLGSAKYAGGITLFVSRNPQNFSTDDLNQPATTAYTGSDGNPLDADAGQTDETFMQIRYNIMSEGHLSSSMSEDFFQNLGQDAYVDDWVTNRQYRDTNTGGSVSQGQGYGPYTLAPGDSIRIVYAEGLNGMSWKKCREVGANWLEHWKGYSTPTLINPDGSDAGSDYNGYKRAWCFTGEDSILKVLNNARDNFESNYAIPQPPPAPAWFEVNDGGDMIQLSWADNAESDLNFDGYVIYRTRELAKDYKSVYTKVFECDATNAVNEFDDKSADRNVEYYYYIQSKDDGSQAGKTLYSSKYLTLSSEPAFALQPGIKSTLDSVRVVPNPYDIRNRLYQYGVDSQFDQIVFYGLPTRECKLRIFTERGDLIWEKDHNNGSGNEIWNSMTSSQQVVVSGVYILHVEAPGLGSVIRKFVIIR
jgi:hypothetical protein